MRLRFAVCACALLLNSACLAAQDAGAPAILQTPPPQPPAARPQGRITGTVFCDDTHKPARGALVMVNPLPGAGKEQGSPGGGQAMVRVGNDGTYTAEHLAPGEYTAVAFQPGYLSGLEGQIIEAMEGNPSPARQREMLARNGVVALRGSETAIFNITLQRGATLSGRVLYSDGAPAAQITLMLENTAAKPPKDEKVAAQEAFASTIMSGMFTHQSMSTDDEGHFRLSGLGPGSYRLAATQPSHGPMDSASEGGEEMGFFFGMIPDARALRFYAGDTPHRSAAKVFDLRAGDQVGGIEITVPVDAFHTVRGSAAAVDGRPINMGSVTLTDSTDDTLVLHGGMDAEGNFRLLQVPSGTYTLKVTNARIGKSGPLPNGQFLPEGQLQPTNAFADNSTAVLVKDSDVADVRLTLTEVPLPKAESDPKPTLPNDEPKP